MEQIGADIPTKDSEEVSYTLFQPVLHNWYKVKIQNKNGMTWHKYIFTIVFSPFKKKMFYH